MSDKVVTIAGQQAELFLEREGARFRAGDSEIEVTWARDNEAEIRVGERTFVVPYIVDGTRISFAFDGVTYNAEVTDRGAKTRTRHRDHSMAAPMPGLILKILVTKGDVVTKGAPLIVLEAMKMEHQIVATHDGTVSAVNCVEGELVQPGVDLVELS
ncbi:MAG: acetyl-CoA carboxylase biotin carboxyl carrier protein subunit [Thermoanaerobaculia bacterium]